jgi:hypothetical protein
MDQMAINYGRIRFDSIPQIDGTVLDVVIVPAHIGNHGPFAERFTKAEFETPGVVEQRFNALRNRLQSLPK